MYATTVKYIINQVKEEFANRVELNYLKLNPSHTASVDMNVTETELHINLIFNGAVSTITVPIPYIEDGVEFISKNDVTRPVCKYLHKNSNKEFCYLGIIKEILLGSPSMVLPDELHKSKSHTMQLIKYGYENNNLAYTVYNIQKQINYFTNRLPIHNTLMNSWVMNKRLTIIDKNFDDLTNPEDMYNYQIEKNKIFFGKGWTSLGLSDGSLANFNYMLTTDLRNLTPFGQTLHNPQRNLYSTLGMKGDEKPLIKTTSMDTLEKAGIGRTGWNLFTAFVDIPDVWEDQIMVDESHANKFVESTKKYICFNEVVVAKGDTIRYGSTLCVNDDVAPTTFNIVCDDATITDIKDSSTVVGGTIYNTTNVFITYKRYLKDGTKITNLAANKGVIRLKKLGHAIDPRTGLNRKIDVIVSSKAVLKRKNYTQIVEAILNTINNDQPIIVDDYAATSEETIKQALVGADMGKEGVWECDTYAGKLNCVCGKVFWGVTHDADDTTWRKGVVENTNGRGNRTHGLKFSTIEFRALNTRFGNDNHIEKEILSYSQGIKDVREYINILRSKLGKFIYTTKTIHVNNILPMLSESTMYTESQLENTIADPNKHFGGFYMQLPIKYQMVIGEDDEILSDGFPGIVGDEVGGIKVKKKIIIDKLYVPCYSLRKCWKHDVSMYGTSEISNLLNIIIIMCHKYKEDPHSGINLTMIYKSIYNYFNTVTKKLGTKKGEISTLGLSVRYPYSVKAVATLSNSIPKNTVQIHRSMAKTLNVKEGDIVLVERFPCLGFMSIRPQKITITNDSNCKFTIRVSGNSLGSMTLDFDGDVIYLASFHSKNAKKVLRDEWENPNKHCIKHINYFNKKMGIPRTKEMTLSDYSISTFEPLTSETHAAIVGKLTGVKSYTGPVVALAYNLLRIMENSPIEHSCEVKAGIEVFIDTVANSVFKQKHGKKSLHKVVIDAVCTADVKILIKEGFDPMISKIVCDIIKNKASKRGIKDLIYYHEKVKKDKKSNIINRIVREENKLYFTSRAALDIIAVVNNITKYAVVDIPSNIFSKVMSGKFNTTKTQFDKFKDYKLMSKLNYNSNEEYATVKELFNCLDNMFSKSNININTLEKNYG